MDDQVRCVLDPLVLDEEKSSNEYNGIHKVVQEVCTECDTIIVQCRQDGPKAASDDVLKTILLKDVGNQLELVQQQIETGVTVKSNLRNNGLVSISMSRYTNAKCYWVFLSTGKLCTYSQIVGSTGALVTRDEYLLGVIEFTEELRRLGTLYAIERQLEQVELCFELVQQVNDELMQFKFRNSILRRRYDGLKYSVKALKTVLLRLNRAKTT